MKKKILVLLISVAMVLSLIPATAFAANSLDALKAQVPASAIEFVAGGISGNGLNGPNTIWWDYHPELQSGDVYLLVASSSAGKIANGALLGSAVGVRLDSYAPGGNGTAYTLIKFTGVWLNGDELLQVDMGNGYNTGQTIKGNVNDYFPQLKNITYWDGSTRLGSDTQLAGTEVTIWDITHLPGVPTGFEFLGWAYVNGSEEPDFEAGDTITLGDQDINLYAVWGKDLSQVQDLVYTVEYTLDGAYKESYPVTKKVWILEDLATFTITPDPIDAANNRYVGYKLATDPFVAPAAVKHGDTITVPYIKDDSQTRDVTYTVKYTRGNVEVTEDTYTVTVPVWINEPADVAVPVAAIDAANDRYVGYKLATEPFVAPATAQNGDVITVPYIKDDSQTRNVTYTVKYTRDNVEVTADTYTVTVPVWINEPADFAVPVAAISAASNRYLGYKLATDPFVAPATAQDGDVITVPYVKDTSQTRDVTYTVKYTQDGDEVLADTYTVTLPVWILDPADVAVAVAAISAENDRYLGYMLEDDPFVAPATAQDGDVITVPYVKDESQTRDVVYTVKYTQDGTEVLADTYTVTVPVWINEPAGFAVPVAAISAENDRYVGYMLEDDPFVAPATAQDGDVITVPYVKDESQTRDVTYTVKYTQDGAEVTADTYTVTVPVWILDPDDVAVPVAAISAENDRYVGYMLEDDPFVAPATAQDGDVITVPYIKDESQTRDVTYTVRYTIDSVEVTLDTYEVTVPVWINEPAGFAVPVAAISAANNRYVGYKLLVNPFVAPATAQDGDVITVPYVKDADWTKELNYTIEYYKDNVYIDSELFTEKVWINDSDMLTVRPIDEDIYKPAYELDYTDPAALPATINDGGVIKAYFKKMIFTVTFDPGVNGAFEAVTYPELYYGVATPEAPEALAAPGWEFAGWDPVIAATVTEDVTYVAQWTHIPYTVKFLPGAHGDFLAETHSPVYYDDDMPKPPQPFAEFSWKFLGWQGDDGSFYAAPDYRYPSELAGFPEKVTGSVTFTAQWALVNPEIVFPDKIPSTAHFDKWWGDYGIICFAASTTKDDQYTILFDDWYFNVYRRCIIGFGSPGKMGYEIVFTDDDITLWNVNSGKEITNKGELVYDMHELIADGMYYTKDKNYNYGTLQGVVFINPFGSGAKQAWLYGTSEM